mgnify:CR=1 FL=1|jgi:hypothetical protein
MIHVALPFLVLPDSAIRKGELLIGPRGNPLLPADAIYPNWDYAHDLDVCVHIEVDIHEAAAALKVDATTVSLVAILHAGTGAGSVPRYSWELARAPLNLRQDLAVLEASIPGESLSGRLMLDLVLVLAASPGCHSPISPHLPGSKLWSDRWDILLEDGGAARFPVELISFGAAFPDTRSAGWRVHWPPGSLDADFGGSVRIYVNSDIRELAKRFADGDPLTLQAILADVMTQMIGTTLLRDDAESALESCNEGSIGEQIRFWLESAFPGQSTATIITMMRNRPWEFHAAINSLASMETC